MYQLHTRCEDDDDDSLVRLGLIYEDGHRNGAQGREKPTRGEDDDDSLDGVGHCVGDRGHLTESKEGNLQTNRGRGGSGLK